MSTIVTTGWKLAQAIISNGEISGNKWSNPNNLLLVDNDFSESNPGNNAASDVAIGNFNIDLPSDAVVVGIEIKLFGYRGAQTAPVITISPNALDNTSGENVYSEYTAPFAGLTEDYDEYILGSPTYLFDRAWTVDQINNFKLSLLANGDVYLDAAQINVFYYVPDPVDPPTPVGNRCSDCNAPIQAQPFALSRPFLVGQTKAYVYSFNYPDGTPIQYTDLGQCGGYIDLTFDPGKPKVQGSNFEENAFTALWTVLESGEVELDFSSTNNRGLAFHTPYDHDADLMSDHDINSPVIISNNGHYENRFVRQCQLPIDVFNELVAGDTHTFTLANVPTEGTVRVYGGGSRLYPDTDYTIVDDVITTIASYGEGSILADYQY